MHFQSLFSRPRSLNAKFLLIVLPPVVLCYALFSLTFGLMSYRSIQEDMRVRLEDFVAVESAVLAEPMRAGNRPMVLGHLQGMLHYPWVAGAAVFGARGDFVARAGVEPVDRPSGGLLRDIVVRDQDGPAVLGRLVVYPADQSLTSTLSGNLLYQSLLLLLLVAAITSSAFIAHRFSIGEPLQRFLAAIRKADEEGVREPVTWGSRDELGRVIHAYNAMLANLAAKEGALRRAREELENRVAQRTYELRQANQQLQREVADRSEAEERLRQFSEMTNEAVVYHDHGTVVDANEQYWRMFGLERGELLGAQALDKTVTPESLQLVRGYLDKGYMGPYQVDGVKKDGSTFPIEIRAKAEAHRDRSVRVAIIRDLTEQRMAELAIRESEERLRYLSQATFEAIFLSRGGICIEANQAASNLFGFAWDEFVGTHGSLFVAPESRDLVRRKMLQDVAEPYEVMGLRKDGTTFPVEIQARSMPYKGEVVRVTAVRDISERKKAQQDLAEAEERYRNIFENATVGIFRSTMEGRYQSVNPEGARMFGYGSPREMIERVTDITHQFYAHPGHRDELIRLCLERGEVRDMEFEAQRADGSRMFCSINARPILDSHGVLSGFDGFITDISQRKSAEAELAAYRSHLEDLVRARTADLVQTNQDLVREVAERRRAEEALEESERRYRLLAENAADVIWTLDTDLEPTYLSPSVTRLTGYTPEEARSLPLEKLYTPDSVDLLRQGIYRLGWDVEKDGADDGVNRLEVEQVRKDGSTVWVETISQPMWDEWGRFVGVVGVSRDVTERRRLQAEAMHSGQLTVLGELAAGVAHEINNPINGIINYAQILADLSKGGDAQERELAERILGEGERIASIVRSLLYLARDRKQEQEAFSLQEALAAGLELTGSQMEKEHIVVDVHAPVEPLLVMGRAREAQQVFLNLLSNARHALNKRHPDQSPDKRLDIRLERVAGEGGAVARITFLDRGTGIPASDLDRVVEPFFSTKPEREGTGLGLSISDRIVRDHGGRLALRSREMEYTEAVVELPLLEDD